LTETLHSYCGDLTDDETYFVAAEFV
jgi:hypothetical protein